MEVPSRNKQVPLGPVPPLGRWRPSLSVLFAAFAIFVCLLMTGACVLSLMHARTVAVGVARREAENLAQSLARQASSTFDAVDGTLLALTQRVERNGTRLAERNRLRESMSAFVTTMPQLHGLSIIDERGRLIVSNSSAAAGYQLDFSDQPYFRYHRTHPVQAVHISGPARSKTEDTWVLYLTRRLERADGGFAGVAMASISLDYFDASYAGVDVGRSGAIALIADDGTIVLRWPRAFIGAKSRADAMFSDQYKYLTAASYIGASSVDGMRRLFAFQRLDRYPLSIDVGVAEGEYLAAWRTDAVSNYAALAIGTALVGALAMGLAVQMKRRRYVERTLALLPPFDPLTGLDNRRRFDVELEREWRRAARDRTPVGLLLIGVDNLMAYNGCYGREEGDELLISIARTISANLTRPGTLVARYGGLEFGAIMPITNEAAANIVAERIRRALESLEQRSGTPGAVARVSIGAVSLVPGRSQECSALVEAAAAALRDASAATAA